MFALSLPGVVHEGISAIGPMYPVFVFGILFQSAITLYWVLQKLFSIVTNPIEDTRFLDKLQGWNQRFARIALLCGFAGTYIGIAMSIGPLREVVVGSQGTEAVANVMASLENAFMSTLAGILVGSLWAGELNDFLLASLKPESPEEETETSVRNINRSNQLRPIARNVSSQSNNGNGTSTSQAHVQRNNENKSLAEAEINNNDRQ